MILGIDIGGSHITAALVNEDGMAVLTDTTLRYHVHSNGTASEILDTWSNTIREIWAIHNLNATKIGIAMPGPFDYEHGIALMIGTEKYEAIYKMDVRKPLAQRLGVDIGTIRFRNDAEAFLLGEVMGGAGMGAEKALGITLGTGLGSSIYDHGTTIDADRWKLPFEETFAEDYISTRFFVKRYLQLSGIKVKDARALAALIPTDALALKVYEDFTRNLSLFLRDFIRDEQPQVVIIGGNITQAWSIIYPFLEIFLQEEVKTVVIKKAILGEEAALLGAACSWIK